MKKEKVEVNEITAYVFKVYISAYIKELKAKGTAYRSLFDDASPEEQLEILEEIYSQLKDNTSCSLELSRKEYSVLVSAMHNPAVH